MERGPLEDKEDTKKADDAPLDATDSEEAESNGDSEPSGPKKTKPTGMNFDQLLGGSGIGWGLGTLLMLGASWTLQYMGVEMTVPIILALNILPTMVGSMIATYLFTRISRVNYIVDGAKIGIGGFLLTFIYTSFLGQGVGGAYILTGFLLGGVFGGFITKKIYE